MRSIMCEIVVKHWEKRLKPSRGFFVHLPLFCHKMNKSRRSYEICIGLHYMWVFARYTFLCWKISRLYLYPLTWSRAHVFFCWMAFLGAFSHFPICHALSGFPTRKRAPSHDMRFAQVDVEADWPLLPRDPAAIPVVVVLGCPGMREVCWHLFLDIDGYWIESIAIWQSNICIEFIICFDVHIYILYTYILYTFIYILYIQYIYIYIQTYSYSSWYSVDDACCTEIEPHPWACSSQIKFLIIVGFAMSLSAFYQITPVSRLLSLGKKCLLLVIKKPFVFSRRLTGSAPGPQVPVTTLVSPHLFQAIHDDFFTGWSSKLRTW